MLGAEPREPTELVHTYSELVHTHIVLPLSAYEHGIVDEYLDALLALHFDHLGLLDTGW